MAAGLIVIESDQTAAVIDRIIDGESGFIHRVNDVNALAEKIEYLMTHQELIEKLAPAAQQAAGIWPVSRAVNVVRQVVRVHQTVQ